ncbi:DUF1963 domain-containing protein [Yokenella regensburgei]|uniref:DUF1963 domain-containing protein n=1 Tax=Yokenella regensburgei TaxID=158877 RepID=UPI003F151E21
MDDRIPCKNPQCANRILPATADRTEGFCMPCVNARKRQEHDDFIRKNRKTVDVFAGTEDPVEWLKRVHTPREPDPLILWTPCPVPTDVLYRRLSASERRRMAEYAETLFAAGSHEIAQEICTCLAAFTDVRLDVCLRAWLHQGEPDFYSALPFHRAPPDVRDTLLQRVEHDEKNRNGLLIILAWIGDDVVVEQFTRWRQTPPAWCRSLHVPPHHYAHQAGWELTVEGRRRDLYFQHCFHLVKHAPAQPAVFRAVTGSGVDCPHCATPLTTLFDVTPELIGISAGCWSGHIRILTCECCTAYETVFARADAGEAPQWLTQNRCSTLAVEHATDWVKLPSEGLHLGEARLPLFAADQFLPTTFSQLGGHPTWIQDAEYPPCPECAQTMMFLAQISYEDLDDCAEGMLYGFICPECRTTATSYQQT